MWEGLAKVPAAPAFKLAGGERVLLFMFLNLPLNPSPCINRSFGAESVMLTDQTVWLEPDSSTTCHQELWAPF